MQNEAQMRADLAKYQLGPTPHWSFPIKPGELANLLETIDQLTAELEEYRSAASYDAKMSGPVFKGWNRSQLDRARKRTEEKRK